MKQVSSLYSRASDSDGFIASYYVDSVAKAAAIQEWANKAKAPAVLNVQNLDMVGGIRSALGESREPVLIHADVGEETQQIKQAVEVGADSIGVARIDAAARQYLKDRGVWVEVDALRQAQDDEYGEEEILGDALRVRLPVIQGAFSGQGHLLENVWQQMMERLGGRPLAVAYADDISKLQLKKVGASSVYRVAGVWDQPA